MDRHVTPTAADQADFARVTAGLTLLRAGAAGVLHLAEPQPLAPERGGQWISHTPYRPTRHPAKGADPAPGIIADVRRECLRKGLAEPEDIQILAVRTGPRGGVSARLHLSFAQTVTGPLLLGQDAHRGGCLFRTAQPEP